MSNKRDVILTLEQKHTHPTENTRTEPTEKTQAREHALLTQIQAVEFG